MLMNIGQVLMFLIVTKRAESIVDLTVTYCYELENLCFEGLKVDTKTSFSDQRYNSYSIGKYKPPESTFRNPKKATWDFFCMVLDESILPNIISNLDECALALQKLLQAVLDRPCPLRKAIERPPILGGTLS